MTASQFHWCSLDIRLRGVRDSEIATYAKLLVSDAGVLTVDVLCHGVANKSIVNGYLNDKRKKIHKKINDYRFRVKPKDSDWWFGGGTRMRVDFNDGTRFIDNKETGTYFVGFNHYLFLRKSCYECRYVGTDRISDITLADFWGVDQVKITQHEKSLGVSVITHLKL